MLVKSRLPNLGTETITHRGLSERITAHWDGVKEKVRERTKEVSKPSFDKRRGGQKPIEGTKKRKELYEGRNTLTLKGNHRILNGDLKRGRD